MNPIYKFELNRTTVNLLNPKTVVSGLLSTSNGQLTDSTIYQSSDYIPVTPGVNYKLCDADTFTAWAASAACFYTANKTFISGQYGIGETPSNAAYLRVSYQGLNNGYGVFPSTVSSYSAYVSPIAYPIYKDDLAKEFSKESNQEFFRAKLSGKLTFESADYDFIVSQPFDFQFVLEIFISYNAGQSWTSYWRGTFWKTDCEFDGDTQTVVVQPSVLDQYNDVLAGLDKEYNLIELAPEIKQVKADKRPMIQVYFPGQTVIGCFLSGMWWEQECESVLETDTVEISGQTYNALEYKYHFSLNKTLLVADVSGTMSPALPERFTKDFVGANRFNPATPGTTDVPGTDYTFRYYFYAGGGGATQKWQILRNSDSTVMWEKSWSGGTLPDTSLPQTVTLTPVSGTGATGNVVLYVHDMPVYSRFVCDTPQINGLNTYEIPGDDIVENNRNYHRVIGYYFPDTIYFSTRLTTTPNQWGLYQPGQYYQPPYLYWSPEMFPIARNAWGRISIWFTFAAFDWIVEKSGRQQFTIRHAYPLSSVISVLLAQIAPNITHEPTTTYSQFLYGTNILGITQTLLISPKSNIVSAGYDQPAQKAPITLNYVLNMLRDCFRCYWFIDDSGRFRIEHIQYFRNGGSYSGTPVVGIDLTTERVMRNGKVWAFGRDQFKFDKPEMAARYQFGWMDDVTQLFDGYPIDILSKYVNPDKIEQIDVAHFTSDIDFVLLNPGVVSKDGFMLLAGVGMTTEMAGLTASTTAGGDRWLSPNMVVPVGEYGKKITITVRGRGKAGTAVNAVFSGTNVWQYPGLSLTFTETGVWVTATQTFVIPTNTQNDIVLRWYFNSGVDFGDTTVEIVSGVFDDSYMLPYQNVVIDGDDHYLQNALVAFVILQNYYAYDMPARNYSINGVQMYAQGIKKLKNQSIRFPALTDPDLVQLVKTNLGNGVIEKLSVNLSSRNANATLHYDTE